MNKLSQENNDYHIINKKPFRSLGTFKSTSVKKAFDFAYDMSFGQKGEHRNKRSGGNKKRKDGEIFINTFQGKLSELGVYNVLYDKVNMSLPDFDTYDLGEWDSCDFEVNDKTISVKSTKYYGNLLLLETKDWNSNAEYIPNIVNGDSIYNFFILVRISPDSEKIMRSKELLYSNEVDIDVLKDTILSVKWEYDIPGFITNKQLKYVIDNRHIIPRQGMLNARVPMDAENYYIQTGDMIDINKIVERINK